ncbi:PREDICTED: WPP domain-interacting protein 3-like [Tarenaya hassleriana]|uniref:WPP domain-interacting protein 3-like n=1 Tax=Tarenaya hassleriana TaxID=28532 RepID=UPI0008FD2D70|nr:PREDICTED: WPP domain-interacting protein 3-like [Tarenaya hassleriana]
MFSAENGSENGLSPDGDHEEAVGSPQEGNIGGVRVESPGALSPCTRKRHGLKKWRRIKRDSLVKDGAGTVDSSNVLKRGSMGHVNPPSKPADLSSIETRRSSEGSVGSVNMVNHPGVVNVFCPVPGSASNIAPVRIIIVSLSQRVQQVKNQIDTIKKARRERVEAEKENLSSCLDSDLRSSDFVSSSDAFSVANLGKRSERLLNRSGEFSKEGQKFGVKVQNGHRNKNEERKEAEKEDVFVFCWFFSELTTQFNMYAEVQNFREIGRESTPLYCNVFELGSSEEPANNGSATSESEVLLEAKEAKIRALENSKIENELEGIFQREMEAEIEHLLMTRSLETARTPKKMKEDSEQKHGNMSKGKAWKSGICFLIQLLLLVCMIRCFFLQFLPDSQIVIPTLKKNCFKPIGSMSNANLPRE